MSTDELSALVVICFVITNVNLGIIGLSPEQKGHAEICDNAIRKARGERFSYPWSLCSSERLELSTEKE